MKNKKGKILKILFFISFLPFLYLIASSTYHAIFGYDVYTWILSEYVRTIYGFEAFLEVFIWSGLVLCFIPVLPISFIYQVIFLIINFVRKNNNKHDVNVDADVS